METDMRVWLYLAWVVLRIVIFQAKAAEKINTNIRFNKDFPKMVQFMR